MKLRTIRMPLEDTQHREWLADVSGKPLTLHHLVRMSCSKPTLQFKDETYRSNTPIWTTYPIQWKDEQKSFLTSQFIQLARKKAFRNLQSEIWTNLGPQRLWLSRILTIWIRVQMIKHQNLTILRSLWHPISTIKMLKLADSAKRQSHSELAWTDLKEFLISQLIRLFLANPLVQWVLKQLV